MKPRGRLLLGMAGMVAIGGYFALPEPFRSVVYDAPRALAVVACLVAARRQPDFRRMWLLLAGATSWFIVANVVYTAWPTTPSPADAMFVSGYGFVVAALLALPRNKRADLVGAALDAALVTAAASMFVVLFVFEPTGASGAGTLEQIVEVAYPLGDLLLLSLFMTMLLRAPAPTLLGASLLMLLASDLVYAGLNARDAYDADSLVNAGWMGAYVLLGLAALSPPRALPHSRHAPTTGSWRRLTLVGLCLFAMPLAGAIQSWAGVESGDRPVIIGFGAVIAALACIRLVTVARERDRSERHLRALNEATDDVVLIVDADTTILDVGSAVERVLGLPPEAYLGTRALDFVHPDDRASAAAGLGRALHGPTVEATLRLRGADGRYRTVSATGRPLTSGPYAGALILNARDISQRLAIEAELAAKDEQLRQSQKLEAVGQLAGGVAHDFNNLLTAICGYGELAQQEARAVRHEKLSRDIGEMLDAAQRAGTLTRQLLAFSRRQRLAPQRLELNEQLRALDRLFRRLIGEHIELVTLFDDEPLWVEVDPGQLEQVFLNLVVNARDAMPDGGTLTLGIGGGDDVVRLTVSDTGCGMDAETCARAFDPFFTTKAVGAGTGLGLATVYGIVTQSGGDIGVGSQLGTGTTFTLTLPRSEPPDDAHGTVALEVSRGAGRILLVEDEQQVRDVSARMLREAGYDVLEAREGEEGLRALEREGCAIDLLVTDVVMPRMSGPELAKRARRVCPAVRVVFCSGYASDALGRDEAELTDCLFLAKPFSVGELLATVNEALAPVTDAEQVA